MYVLVRHFLDKMALLKTVGASFKFILFELHTVKVFNFPFFLKQTHTSLLLCALEVVYYNQFYEHWYFVSDDDFKFGRNAG